MIQVNQTAAYNTIKGIAGQYHLVKTYAVPPGVTIGIAAMVLILAALGCYWLWPRKKKVETRAINAK